MCSILQILKRGLYITQPNHIYDVIVTILKKSIDLWVGEEGKMMGQSVILMLCRAIYLAKI